MKVYFQSSIKYFKCFLKLDGGMGFEWALF